MTAARLRQSEFKAMDGCTGCSAGGSRQQGSALFVTIVLLLFATALTVFALKIGVFEQRASGNDVRARYVQQMADSAVAEGIEFVREQGEDFTAFGAAHWVRCDSADASFPCGALPAEKRENMFFYRDVTAADRNGDGAADAMDQRMLPMARRVGAVGNGMDVIYGVGIGVCWVSTTPGPVDCAASPSAANKAVLASFVGVASIPGEAARATATQTVGVSSNSTRFPALPPFVATGSVDLNGTMQVVTHPNAGGPGVPVSIWSRGTLSTSGTINTCQADEYFRSGPASFEGDTDFITCGTKGKSGCYCPDSDSLTRAQGGTICPGIDVVVATYGATSASCPPPNLPMDATDPAEFPCDMFEYVFGIKSWDDVGPVDNFCETKRFGAPRKLDGYGDDLYEIGEDVAYLDSHADWIVAGGPYPLRYVGDPRVVSCADAGSKSGLIWIREAGCKFPANKDVGSPDKPVVLVNDGSMTINAGSTVFGVVFLRETACSERPAPAVPTPCAMTAAQQASGGSAQLTLNGGSAIYGSIVVQGPGPIVNGTAHVVASPALLNKMSPGGETVKYKSVPGSWTDRVRY